jgi:serine/threonine-protein kinase
VGAVFVTWLGAIMSFRGFEQDGDAPAERLPVAPGDVVAGKYRIERVIGSGGMGVVVAATHLALGQLVALKFMRAALARTTGAAARFVAEARAAARLRTEHVTRVLDVATLDDGTPYIVFEHLEGRDLAAHLEAEGAMPIESAVDLVLEACDAIAEAHSAGIVHRDLKPQNLFLAERPDGTRLVKVMDFGISKVPRAPGDSSRTGTTELMGSPLYMSPEQMRSPRDVDGRADIWALGAILYELVAGRAAFDADTMPQICANVLDQPLPPLRKVRSAVPTMLELVLERCLEKEPARRYPTVAHLALALSAFASEHGRAYAVRIARVLGVEPILPAPARSEPPPRWSWGDDASTEDAPAIPMTSWWPRVGAVASVVALAAGIGWARERVKAAPSAFDVLAPKRSRPTPPPSATVTRASVVPSIAVSAIAPPEIASIASAAASSPPAESATASARVEPPVHRPAAPPKPAPAPRRETPKPAAPATASAEPVPFEPEPLRPLVLQPTTAPSATATAQPEQAEEDPYEETVAPRVAPAPSGAPSASAPSVDAPAPRAGSGGGAP